MSRANIIGMIESSKNTDVSNSFVSSLIWTIERKEDAKPSKTLKPSSLRCIRSGVYQCLGVEPSKSQKSHNLDGICASGTAVHEYIQSICLDMNDTGWEYVDVGKYISEHNLSDVKVVKPCDFEHGVYETKLRHEGFGTPISFLCDGLLKHKGKYYILEIKSTNAGAFFKQNNVEEKHKAQAIAYSTLLNVDSVIFLYVERDLLNKKCFQYTPTKKEKDKFISDVKYATHCIEYGLIPAKPIEAEQDKRFCAYCRYINECKRSTDEYKYKE